MGEFRHQVNVKFDDITFDILNLYVKELNKKIKSRNPNAEEVTRSDAIRRAILYAYFVGLKGYTLEQAAKILEEGRWHED